MIEWLWESFLLFLRIFVILSLFTVISVSLGAAYARVNDER